MTADAQAILDDYLRQLEQELTGVPAADRGEIMLQVREHFEEARQRLDDPSESQLRNILERLGSPSEIAAEARPASTTTARRQYPALEIVSLALWLVWWPLAALVSAYSKRWSSRQKWFAVLIQAAVTALVYLLVFGLNFISSHRFPALHLQGTLLPPTFYGVAGALYLGLRLRWSRLTVG